MTKVFCEKITEYKVMNEKKSCMRYSRRGRRNIERTKAERFIECNKLNFYIKVENECLYLFSQNFNQETYDFFKNGVILDRCLDYSSAKRNKGILRAMDRIHSAIRYIEQEYGFSILRKTAKKYESREF